jgi:succinate dehydrogenase flavin-adding protein (antitoxin of CptAB toxin-antitoxin module)
MPDMFAIFFLNCPFEILIIYSLVMAQSASDKNTLTRPAKAKRIVTPLDKAKQEFSRLLDQVDQLKKESQTRENQLQEVRRRIQTELQPMLKEVIELRLALNELLESKIAEKGFNRQDKQTLTDLLFYNCDLLEQEFGHDMTEIRLRYLTKSEKKQYEQMGAVEDLFNAFFEEAQKQYAGGGENNAREDSRTENGQKKNARKRKAGPAETPQPDPVDPTVKKKLDLQRYIRSLYLTLVKNIHPDLEQDPGKKQQRTDLMQKVTHAYQQLDLYELLKARKELLEIDEENAPFPDSRSESEELDQLKQYIRILKSQQQEIQSEQFTQSHFSPDAVLLRKFYHPLRPEATEKAFKKEVNVFKKEMKKIRQVQETFEEKEKIRQFLEKVRGLRSLKTTF